MKFQNKGVLNQQLSMDSENANDPLEICRF